MKRPRAAALLAALALLGITAGVVDAQATKSARPSAAAEFAGRWLVVIDSGVTKLRLPVAAMTAPELLRTLNIAPYSDLETKDEFAARSRAVVAGRSFAVRIPIGASDDPCAAKAAYDDDREVLAVSIPAQIEVSNDNIYGAALWCTMQSAGAHLKKTSIAAASTEFGALNLTIDVKVDARNAAALKGRLGLLAILAPAPNDNGAVIVVSKIDEKPTAAEPLEVSGSNTFVWCARAGFVLFDIKTGEIVAKGVVDRHAFSPRRLR